MLHPHRAGSGRAPPNGPMPPVHVACGANLDLLDAFHFRYIRGNGKRWAGARTEQGRDSIGEGYILQRLPGFVNNPG